MYNLGNCNNGLILKHSIELNANQEIIPYIYYLKINKGNILVNDFVHSRSCYRFSLDGKFLNKYGELGQGPGEYDVNRAVGISDNQVMIVGFNWFNIYNVDGTYKKRIRRSGQGIPNLVYSDNSGNFYLYSFNRYNSENMTVLKLDSEGKKTASFSPYNEKLPKVFDTYNPQTNGYIRDDKLYQIFNYDNYVRIYSLTGNLLKSVKLDSPSYVAPIFKDAKDISGQLEELQYRSTFTQYTWFSPYQEGYISVLTCWKDNKHGYNILAIWDEGFNLKKEMNIDESNILDIHNDEIIMARYTEDKTILDFFILDTDLVISKGQTKLSK